MSESIWFIGGMITMLIAIVITALIGYFLANELKKKDPLNLSKPGSNTSLPKDTPSGMQMVNRMQSLYHLPEREDPKNLQRWALERLLQRCTENFKDLNYLDMSHEIYLQEIFVQTQLHINFFKAAVAAYNSMKGPIPKDIFRTLEKEHVYIPETKQDKELKENPVYNRNKFDPRIDSSATN